MPLSAPQTIFFIREVNVKDDPAQPLALSGRKELPPPRAPLPADPADWPMADGDWAGVSQELRWVAGTVF